jgi:hypothetical protein
MPFRSPSILSSLALITLLVGGGDALACDSRACSCAKPTIARKRQGGWWIATSANFHVCSSGSIEEAEAAADHCEKVRERLAAKWQFEVATPWNPKCHVVLHPHGRSYIAAVGNGAEATAGSSLVKPSAGVITSRRIDLRTDVGDYLNAALPHEMCHLLVADKFRASPAPLWYDEGLALLVDPPAKLRLHQRDLEDGMRRGIALRLADVLTADRYPSPDRIAVFYGQCASVTQLLLQEGAPERVHQFAAQIHAVGLNPALRSSYEISSVAELEKRWTRREHVRAERGVASFLPIIKDGELYALTAVKK